ncbi:MAG: RNA polymerase sigma-70 factor [Bacteroidales bacterium]|nr:RNA polymerase sigma-70 factor [Bacteroidales bacterium]
MTDFIKTVLKDDRAFLAFAFSYIRDKAESEDIVMESIASLWENRYRWDRNSNLKALLLTIIKNKALNYLKHLKIRLSANEKIGDYKSREINLRISTLEECSPELIFSGEIDRIVKETLNTLPEKSRRIFNMSRYGGQSNKKIAESLGISVKAVEFHITRTLKSLRLALRDYILSFFL